MGTRDRTEQFHSSDTARNAAFIPSPRPPRGMTLEDLNDDVEEAYASLNDQFALDVDRETKHELAMLMAVLDVEPGELIRRGVHALFQASVDTARIDFHLRSEYGVTYEEYLSGMTYEEMTGAANVPQPDDDRRYQF